MSWLIIASWNIKMPRLEVKCWTNYNHAHMQVHSNTATPKIPQDNGKEPDDTASDHLLGLYSRSYCTQGCHYLEVWWRSKVCCLPFKFIKIRYEHVISSAVFGLKPDARRFYLPVDLQISRASGLSMCIWAELIPGRANYMFSYAISTYMIQGYAFKVEWTT